MKHVRARVWNLIDANGLPSPGGTICRYFLICLIVLNSAAMALETVPDAPPEWYAGFRAFEAFSVIVFTIEYLVRLWAAPEDPRYARLSDWRARLRFARSPIGIVDLLAVLPFYLAFFVAPVDLRFLRLLRLLRILKLTRYSPALATMAAVLKNERHAVIGAACVLAVLVFVASTVMYDLEHEAQPDAFGSIPQAMWWAMETLTTVGYGDVVPQTPAGRIVGSLVMILGIGVFVLWTSIFSAGFIEESRRRNFVVTWKLVAQVPAFAHLGAERIADISQLLKPEIVPARFTVIRRGEVPRAMFFVVSGTLEIDLPTEIVRIEEGQFFGETGLLEDSVRRATVTTLSECHLLRLEKSDFERLMEDEPELREAIARISRERSRSVEASEI